MPASFNNSEVNGLTKLVPGVNSQGMGAVTTSAGGNAVRVIVGGLAVRSSTFAAPGSDWTGYKVLGKSPRQVVWEWQVCCANDADVNAVERYIEAYISDGREYVLDDGKGRTSDYVVLREAQRIGYRERTSDNRRLQRWRLTFDVLLPKVEASRL